MPGSVQCTLCNIGPHGASTQGQHLCNGDNVSKHHDNTLLCWKSTTHALEQNHMDICWSSICGFVMQLCSHCQWLFDVISQPGCLKSSISTGFTSMSSHWSHKHAISPHVVKQTTCCHAMWSFWWAFEEDLIHLLDDSQSTTVPTHLLSAFFFSSSLHSSFPWHDLLSASMEMLNGNPMGASPPKWATPKIVLGVLGSSIFHFCQEKIICTCVNHKMHVVCQSLGPLMHNSQMMMHGSPTEFLFLDALLNNENEWEPRARCHTTDLVNQTTPHNSDDKERQCDRSDPFHNPQYQKRTSPAETCWNSGNDGLLLSLREFVSFALLARICHRAGSLPHCCPGCLCFSNDKIDNSEFVLVAFSFRVKPV